MEKPWDIYAQRLIHHGYGHPLWGPEPDQRFGEVRLGDVGYLDDGHFCFLFNAMRSAEDPVNSQHGVPSNFVVFELPQYTQPIHRPNEMTHTQLHSKSLRSVEVAATASASMAVASAGAGLRYRCNEDSGALLLLKQPAHKTFLACKLYIQDYMVAHFPSWCEFANERLGLGLDEKDILFVSGFMKTTVWGVASFSDCSGNTEVVVAGGCFVSPASGEFRVSMSQGFHASVHSRIGPLNRVSARIEGDDENFEYDQCIFLNYYKLKNRGLRDILGRMSGRPLRAAGGWHRLPGPDLDDDPLPTYSSNLNPPSYSANSEGLDHVGGGCYDPVDKVLDYILKHSTADLACASDQDLSSLFGDHGIPSCNLEAELELLAPKIILKESAMGIFGHLSVEASDNARFKNNDGIPKKIFKLQPIVIEKLPNLPYATMGSTSSLQPHCVYFQAHAPSSNASPESYPLVDDHDGYPLLKALDNDFTSLINGLMPAPLRHDDGASTKVSIKFLFPGCRPYAKDIIAYSLAPGFGKLNSISMSALAHRIAKEMKKYLMETREAGMPLMHRGQIVELEDLYLWRLERVSKDSWIPEFKVKIHPLLHSASKE